MALVRIVVVYKTGPRCSLIADVLLLDSDRCRLPVMSLCVQLLKDGMMNGMHKPARNMH